MSVPRWEYLNSEAFRVRYVLAGWMLRGLPLVVEVGGWCSCVADHLGPSSAKVFCVDPLLEFGSGVREGHEVECRRSYPYDVDWSFLEGKEYGFCFMGFEVVGHDVQRSFECVERLVRGSKAAVVEHATDHKPSVLDFGRLLSGSGKKLVLSVAMDLHGNDVGSGISFPPFWKRRVCLLK